MTRRWKGYLSSPIRAHLCHPRFLAFFPIFLLLIFLSKDFISIHRERTQRAQKKDSILCVLCALLR